MVWKIEFSITAQRQIKKFQPQVARRISNYLNERIAPAVDPRASGHGLIAEFSGLWRYREGDHCIICEIRDKEILILVVEIGDRKDVCR